MAPAHLRRRPHRILLALVIVGEVAIVGVRGTYASYNSVLVNPNSSAASGTVSLETAAGGAACDSWGGSVGAPVDNLNPSCGAMAVSAGPFLPGQSTESLVTVTNAGSAFANDLSVYATTPCSPAEPPAGTSATPAACDGIEFSVQEVGAPVTIASATLTNGTSTVTAASFSGVVANMVAVGTGIPADTTVSAVSANSVTLSKDVQVANGTSTTEAVQFASPIACYYPTSATRCSFATSEFTSAVDGGQATELAGVGTLSNFTYYDYYDASDCLNFGALPASADRYFVLSYGVPTASTPGIGNDYQGGTAKFTLTWYLNQAPPAPTATASPC